MNFLFWLDNCVGQNKNWILFRALCQTVNTLQNINSITLNYLEHGHTFMKADSVHGAIGRKIQKTQFVFTLEDLQNLIDRSGYSIESRSLQSGDSYTWQSIKPKLSLPKISTIKIAYFEKGSRDFHWKTSYRSKTFLY